LCSKTAITKHLKNIFDTEGPDKKVVSSILEHTAEDDAIKGKYKQETINNI